MAIRLADAVAGVPLWAWRRGDLLDHEFVPKPDFLIAHFLLHQFSDAELGRLGRAISDIPVWILCEPCRSRLALAGLAALRPFGLHEVSRHDGQVSVVCPTWNRTARWICRLCLSQTSAGVGSCSSRRHRTEGT